jgi:hypothetical protein
LDDRHHVLVCCCESTNEFGLASGEVERGTVEAFCFPFGCETADKDDGVGRLGKLDSFGDRLVAVNLGSTSKSLM